MTTEEIDEMSEDDMRARLHFIYGKKSLIESYLTIEEKMLSIASQFREGFIDVMSEKDDPAFDRFIKYSKESKNIEESQLGRLSMIDEDILAQERDKRLKAKPGTLESFIPKPK